MPCRVRCLWCLLVARAVGFAPVARRAAGARSLAGLAASGGADECASMTTGDELQALLAEHAERRGLELCAPRACPHGGSVRVGHRVRQTGRSSLREKSSSWSPLCGDPGWLELLVVRSARAHHGAVPGEEGRGVVAEDARLAVDH